MTDEASMRSMVQAILTVAAGAKVGSIALPLLGGGSAGWPIALAAKAQIAKLVDAALTGSAGSTLKVSLLTADALHLTLLAASIHMCCLQACCTRFSLFYWLKHMTGSTGSTLKVSLPLINALQLILRMPSMHTWVRRSLSCILLQHAGIGPTSLFW